MTLQRKRRKTICGCVISGDQAGSLASGIAGTNKIQSLAKEPVDPSKSGPAKPFPGSRTVGGHGQKRFRKSRTG
jgi:hypothetical protein